MTTSEWSEKKLGDIAETTSGGTPDRKNPRFFGGSIPWVKSGELEDNFIDDTAEKITPDGLKHSAAKVFPAGTLLMAMYGATVGRTALLNIEAATNQAVCAIFPKANHARPDFLRYALVYQRPEILKLRYGGAQPNISQQVIRSLAVPVPPIAEQRRIAGVLALAQRAIEQQERLIAVTTELKRALVEKLFTEGLRGEAQKETEIGPIPQSWEAMPLGDVISQSPKNGLYKHNTSYGSGTLILRINDFSNDGDKVFTAALRVSIDASEIEQYALRKDDIVTNRVNSLSHLGKTALVGRLEEPMVFESNMMRFRVDENHAIPAYVLRLLNSPICKKQFLGSAKRAVGQASINQGNLRAIKIPLPSVLVQQEILEMLDTVIRSNEIHHRRQRALTALFRTLLHRLMTAQLRANDLELAELETLR